MPNPPELGLYRRKSLDLITEVPDDIISVYVVEQHIWSNKGSEEERKTARRTRQAETQTVSEFLIDPVRPFLTDLFRQISAPYDRSRRDNPIGQGYWIQAEFGSGKSHLLSFLGALALGDEKAWEIVREREEKAGRGKRESLYTFYENGLRKKTAEGRGILVAVMTLVGQGSGGVGLSGAEKTLTEYILNAVGEQFYLETGRSLPLYPTQILAERFLMQDLERYSRDLARFLKDPRFFDDEKQETLEEFLQDLQNNPDPGVQRDCGQRLWDFYDHYLQTRPNIPMETEPVLKHMLERLLEEGYAGLLLILDEVSLFMKGRVDSQRVEDEKALVVLSNRMAKVENLPVWTVCAAQQAIETKLVGIKNIIADERLKLVLLLKTQDDYYNIALARVREITDKSALGPYYEDYKRSFSWPEAFGRDEFERYFPFYKPALDVVRAISFNQTTVRSALYYMLQTLKNQRAAKSNELVTLWALFDDVVRYEEDPSGTTRSIAGLKTKFPDEWRAFEETKRLIDSAVSGPLKVYRSRCEKIVKTLFLFHIAELSPGGLTHIELMNAVMEWKDHDKEQRADLRDNQDHYELLADKLDTELVQVEKVNGRYRFIVTGTGTPPQEIFQKARNAAEGNEVMRRDAWRQLLDLDGWSIQTGLMSLELAGGIQSIFREIAPESQQDLTIKWHGREISGRVYMRDLLDVARRGALLPSINSAETGLDFAVFVSHTPVGQDLDRLVREKGDPRVLFWSPDRLIPAEQSLLVDFAAYRSMVADALGQDTEKAKAILDWVQGRLRAGIGSIYRMIPDSFGRGRITATEHAQFAFDCAGELSAILAPLVGQVLDSVYACREMEFTAPAPFNDTNAINVINGIVKMGKFPRGIRPAREVSASRNYGVALGILRPSNDHQLDLSECRYTTDLMDWVEEKIGASGTNLAAATVYKNFMGIGGPNGLHYGLSKRMVQLYLLCLAREGRIRIGLSGRGLPAEAVDYTNIESLDFRTNILDAFDQIQRLKPPEGWEVLSPFAAILLDDPAIKTVNEEAAIQQAVLRLQEWKNSSQEGFRRFYKGMADLAEELRVEFIVQERLKAWKEFLEAPVDVIEPIAHLRNALKKAFGYPVYPGDEVHPGDLDDLTARRVEIRQAELFYAQRDGLRCAWRYLDAEIPDTPELSTLKREFGALAARRKDLDAWTGSETRLFNELLNPIQELIESYRTRYLQALDQVQARTEQTRQLLESPESLPAFRTLAILARVPALGEDGAEGMRKRARFLWGQTGLFPQQVTRASVVRELGFGPQPAGCPLTLANVDQWLLTARHFESTFIQEVETALLKPVHLLCTPALRKRLEAGKQEDFIRVLLGTLEEDQIVDWFKRLEAAGELADKMGLLEHYLKRIRVIKISLADFQPSRNAYAEAELEQILTEFKRFLVEKAGTHPDDEHVFLEITP